MGFGTSWCTRRTSLAVVLSGVIFDLDGTLGDTLPVCFSAFRSVFSEFLGITYTDDEIRAMFGPTEEGILSERIPVDEAISLRRYLDAYAAAHHLAPEPFPGMVAVLDELERRKVPVAVVTGKGRHSAALSLEQWGLADRFTHVAAGGSNGNIKDRNMAEVIAAWGVAAPQVVSVGDAPSDITAARSVGLVPVGAAWASTAERSRLEPLGPDAIFDDVESFAVWMASRLGA